MPKLIVDQQGRILSNGSGKVVGFDNIPPIVVLSNLPANPTGVNSADITVGGEDVVTYKYKLDNGSYSAETPVSSHIQLSSLADGSHTLYVLGKDSAGNWNPEISATTHTWTVSTIVTSGLSLLWDASNPTSYPGTGTTWYDISGNNKNGTLTNGAVYNSNNGQRIVFDGANDAVTLGSAPLSAYPFSVCLWATHDLSWKTTYPGTMLAVLVNTNIAGQRVTLGLENLWNTNGGLTIMYGGTNHWSTNTLVTPNGSTNWHHISFIVYGNNNSNHKLYIDGVAATLVTTPHG